MEKDNLEEFGQRPKTAKDRVWDEIMESCEMILRMHYNMWDQ